MIGMQLPKAKELVQQSCNFTNLITCLDFRTSSRGGSKTLATPKIKFSVTFVDGRKPQTNATKSFILDFAMVLDT